MPDVLNSESLETEQVATNPSETPIVDDTIQDIQDDPNLTPAEKKAEIKKIKSLKLKVDGEEFDEELPFEIDDDPKKLEYLKKNLQMSKVAQKRMKETAQLQKDVANFVEELRKNPRKVLSDPNLGVDLKEIAKQILQEEIDNSQKSPEQIEKEKMAAELKALKDEREKEKADLQQKEMARLEQQEMERYDMKITKALENSPLPKSPYIVKKMADYLLLGVANNILIEPEDLVPVIQAELQDELKQMFAVMPEDVIESFIGKDILTKLRKKNLKKAPPTPINKSIKDVGTKTEKKEKPESKQSWKQFLGV